MQETSCNLKLQGFYFWERHIMVVIIPNFHTSVGVFPPIGRHSSEQAGLGEKGNTKAVGKYSLGKRKKLAITATLSQMD